MAQAAHANWIGGEWRPAANAATFVRDSRVDAPESWPRSGADDVRAAIMACAAAATRWSSLSRAARVDLLRRVTARLDPRALAETLGPDLGLDSAEFAGRMDEDVFRCVEAIELLEQGEDAHGVGVFAAHWSDFAGALAGRVASRLISGQTVIVLSDPRLPRAAEEFARACEAADLPQGVVSILHSDGRDALDAALDTPGLAFVRVKDLDERLDTLESRHGARIDASWELWRVCNSSRVVARGDDPSLAAREVVDTSLARSSTLSGQFPGRTARVLCHERLFSRFSEELLARLADSPDVARPVSPLDADLTHYVADAWSLGLDEGATPIFGASPWDRDDALAGGASPAPGAIAFTNVDPRYALAHLARPAPVLGLIRVASDDEARELQRELDGAPKRDFRAQRP